MAHTQGTAGRLQRLTSLLATALVAIATAMAFARVFQGRRPTLQLLLVGLASAIVAWIFERRSLLSATVASGALLVVTVGIVVARETTWHGLPTVESLRLMGTAAAAVGEQARIQMAPTPPIDALMLAGVVAVWASVFSCHALAFRAGSPLLALVPPVALVAFADTVLEEFIKPQYGVLFLVAALAVVFADGLRRVQGWGPVWNRPGGRDRLMSSAGRGARRIAVAAVAFAAAAPLLIPGFGAKGLIDLSSVNSSDRISVAPLVSIGAQLSREDPVDVFSVDSSLPSDYWRMLTLDRFTDISWESSDTSGTPIVSGEPFMQSGEEGTTVTQQFTVANNLGFRWLPTAPNATLVTADAELLSNVITGTITVETPLDAGDTYFASSTLVEPDPQELQATSASGFDPKYIELPADLPEGIGMIAKNWTAAARDDYSRVLAIQTQLRGFRYSLDVDPEDDPGALLRFLRFEQAGFCQQFSSAMAVLLRTLRIPSRVAMGFTAGNVDDDGIGTVVTTENLHSWVEVYFPGFGWLPFEPTPGRDIPEYQKVSFSQPCTGVPGGCTTEGPNGEGTNAANVDPTDPRKRPKFPPRRTGDLRARGPLRDTAGAGAGDAPERRISPSRVLVVLGALVAVLLVVVPAIRIGGRRRRLRRAGPQPRRLILATYDVFTERAADLGLRRDAGETPGEYRRRIVATGRLSDGHLDRLTKLAVRAAYAPDDPADTDALDATADADHALRDLRKRTSLGRRLAGIYRRD